jgi:recombination protein RecR
VASGGYPESVKALIEEFAKLPGVGARTAERFAFWVLGAEKEETERLAAAIRKVSESVRSCGRCFNLSEGELCSICSDASRERGVLCVVEEPKDILTIEKAGTYRGLYHVLMGALSPLDGIGPRDLRIHELLERLKAEPVREALIATSPDTEGEATALYLARILKPLKLRVTRLAQGIPVGGDLEFVDRATLMRAIEARQEI